MTLRLYYEDAYCTRFTGRVLERLSWEDQAAVVLDQTAFYPTSGGQPADRGVLGGVVVVDVVAREADGAVVHVLERPLAEREEGEGVVDWARRFDHMQQHTGQHVLSAAFEQFLGADTVGFHMGADASTVDIAVKHLEPEVVAQVEALANQVVWEDRPVNVRFADAGELETLSLRRTPMVDGPLRVVEIAAPDVGSGSSFDLNACGGTHVARTGEIGLIKVVRLDYRGDQTRVEFVCGGRAWRDYGTKHGVVDRLGRLLTVGILDLEGAVTRMQDEAKSLRHELRQARQRLLSVDAAELAEAAVARGDFRVVCRAWRGREPGDLRALAQELAHHHNVAAFLASVDERVHVCFARGDQVDLDVVPLLKEVCGQLGGKGGGQPHLAQGSAPVADLSRVEAVLDQVLAALENDGKHKDRSHS